MTLRTYTGERMDVKGEVEVDVQCGNQRKLLCLQWSLQVMGLLENG